ncbi:unnamed protein product [Mesocestoides corti]|uniref:Uncharacterized protein n=1 Tax=Mesocestoides corti TaxID=53468 RepID=A0A0R3UFV8_MESCO|nr:unnamed protein product [Mesocestoides corti]
MDSVLKAGRALGYVIHTSYRTFLEGLYREFERDPQLVKPVVNDTNNFARRVPSDEGSDESGDDSSDLDESDDDESEDESGDETDESPRSLERKRKCCLCCACFECCVCFRIPCRYPFDAVYHAFQRKIDGCPVACPTLIPRSVEEEWRFKGGYGARFAICESCSSPECIVCLKWFDTLLCPVCALWEIVKGIDFGYRRFRIQAYIHRHHEAVRGYKTMWV